MLIKPYHNGQHFFVFFELGCNGGISISDDSLHLPQLQASPASPLPEIQIYVWLNSMPVFTCPYNFVSTAY